MTREEAIRGLECCMIPGKGGCDDCPYFGKGQCQELLGENAIALLKEYDDALKLMVYQYCTMKPPTLHDEVFHNRFMSAGEAAFRLLGLENGQSTDGVWERWFPNG